MDDYLKIEKIGEGQCIFFYFFYFNDEADVGFVKKSFQCFYIIISRLKLLNLIELLLSGICCSCRYLWGGI